MIRCLADFLPRKTPGSGWISPPKGYDWLAGFLPRTADFLPFLADFLPRTADFLPRKPYNSLSRLQNLGRNRRTGEQIEQ